MNIASSLNDKYAPYTYVMLSSLYKNNCDSKIDVYLLEADLIEESKRGLKELADEYGNTVHFVKIWWDYALDTVYSGQLIMDFVETHFENSDFYDAIRKAEEFNENLKRDIKSAVLAFKKMYELVYKKTDDIFTDEMSFSDSVKHIDIPIGEREMDHGEAFVRAVISDRSVEDYVGKLRTENEALNRQLEMALKAYEALRKMVQ